MKTEKVKYIKPSIQSNRVEMEQGIAAGSANVNSGSSSNPGTPGVGDWSDTGSTDTSTDM
ncbi:MAG: hypothetical protein K0R59_199 [Sphingobacterium sp.]|jgi:hypothetical protein|nr:hypothetical protein [Sphingobacterium sp.]